METVCNRTHARTRDLSSSSTKLCNLSLHKKSFDSTTESMSAKAKGDSRKHSDLGVLIHRLLASKFL